ncbi:MAG TPA: YihY/virulence factor BrkB family protein [Verrucomicrobiae bacterium]|nr:YihY/virulence factor BrkB family protein [Verrucomicrobiae bacterium]
MRIKDIFEVIKGTFKEFMEDKAMRLAAALAYYAIFSIGPLMFVLVSLAGWIFGDDAVRGQVHGQISGMVGEESAKTIESMMAAKKLGTSPITTILGVITLAIGASGVFGQLQDALNTIWEVKAKPGLGIWSFLRDRFLSMSMVLGLGFLLLISMVLTTAVQALVSRGGQLLPIPDAVTGVLSEVFSFVVVGLLFAMIYKFLPDVKLGWSDVFTGALVTAALFTGGKFLLGLYLGREGTASSYGAAGSVVVILLWIYYSTIILLFGAEFTQTYALKRGHKLEPSKYAVPVTQEARAQEGMPKPESVEPERARVYAHQTLGPLSAAPLAAGAPGSLGGGRVAGRTSNGTLPKIFPWASLVTAIGIGVATGYRITRDVKTGRHHL